MKQVAMAVMLGFMIASLASAQNQDAEAQKTPKTSRLTCQYLLSHGFKESPNYPGVFERARVRLGDVSRDLGFSIASLRPTLNQPLHSDVRMADVQGRNVLVRSEVQDSKGRIVEHSLDRPDALCTVSVSLRPRPPEPEYLKTDSAPRLRIKSVEMPNDMTRPWQITFELSATGKKPVAILQRNFDVLVTRIGPQPLKIGAYLLFPDQTPNIIKVSPDRPMSYAVQVPPDAIPEDLLSSGEYALQIVVGAAEKVRRQTVDYEWQGEGHSSDKYKFVIK